MELPVVEDLSDILPPESHVGEALLLLAFFLIAPTCRSIRHHHTSTPTPHPPYPPPPGALRAGTRGRGRWRGARVITCMHEISRCRRAQRQSPGGKKRWCSLVTVTGHCSQHRLRLALVMRMSPLLLAALQATLATGNVPVLCYRCLAEGRGYLSPLPHPAPASLAGLLLPPPLNKIVLPQYPLYSMI